MLKRISTAVSFRVRRLRFELQAASQDVRVLQNAKAVIGWRWGLPTERSGFRELLLRDGTKFSVHPNSMSLYRVFVEVFYNDCYEKYFRIEKTDTVIDIGGNIGFFTVLAAKRASAGHVYTFEPCSLHYKLLERNVAQNGIHNVSLFKSAVSSKSGEAQLFYTLTTEPDGTSVYSSQGDRSETVPTISLDEIFEGYAIKQCDFLKIDCEGAEYEILLGASDETLRRVAKLALEWHRYVREHDPALLLRRIEDAGLKVLAATDPEAGTGYIHARRIAAQ